MKTASQIFYLAVFALLDTSHAAADPKPASTSQYTSPDVCAISPKSIVSDACASYSTLDGLNRELKPALEDLTKRTDFFAYYRLNLYNECPFWSDANGMCGNIACAVNTLNEDDIPEIWRAEELGRLQGPKAEHPGRRLQQSRGPERPLQGELGDDVGESCVVEYDDECDDRDYCVPEDEGAESKGDYVSLVDNRERFTGYAGEGAAQVWNTIYRENCFSKSSFPKSASLGKSLLGPVGPAADALRSVLQEQGRQQALEERQKVTPSTPFVTETGLEHEDECLEKRVFYRVISGMHASISTHLCWEYLNQTTGEWGPNLECYKERLHGHPDRVSNLYFNYALVLRAVTKLGPYLQDYTFCTGDPVQDMLTKAKVQSVTSHAADQPAIFDESLMFVNGEGPSLKEDFRNRFRNVSRVMDCVGCDKCRLWGKVQTAGYGTALKVLFEFDNNSDDVPVLKRTELVALFNTLARISNSLTAIQEFRTMVESEETEAESEGHFHVMKDRAKQPHHVVPGKAYEAEAVAEDYEEHDKEAPMQRKPVAQEESTVWEDIRAEILLVYKVYVFILKGWIAFPKNL
ncbi:endoplasmic Reticulum Oxidoreductin 1 [Phlyctema vagabunda]|uniref:Endoplasmic Reticulum Oxidoreductin 1 n=1 Tax=Phlyctema vagabunda TaxID=108571 RepID=A0ABR4PFQ3_9HELO